MAESVLFTTDEIEYERIFGDKSFTGTRSVTIIWDCGAGAATITNTDFDAAAMAHVKGLRCTFAITLPGNHAKCAGTAPTALYDIEILDEYDIDVFGGNLNNRSATESEQQVSKVGDGLSSRLVAGTWTFKLSGNSVNDANGKVVLYFEL